jgi:type 2 lantibiotic biosynthesis protein LanM
VAVYRLLRRRREELLAPDGPLARFAQDEIRILPRSGPHYSSLLDESFHPDLMRDALDRERLLDRLWQAVEREPALARLIPYEKADLLAGDIPLFTTLAGSRDVYSSDKQRIANFFPQSGLAAARQRVAALSEDDLARQRWFIRATLATVAKETRSWHSYRRQHFAKTMLIDSASASAAEVGTPIVASTLADAPIVASTLPAAPPFLDLARAIGARLDHLALRAEEEASWLGVALVEKWHWEIKPLDMDLYNGLPGVALFLAQLGASTGQARWTKLAQAAAATLRRYIAEEMAEGEEGFPAVGVFDGLGGLLYALACLARYWQQPDLLQTAARLVPLAQERAAEAEERGLARGLAGGLAGLLALHQAAPTPQTQAAAQQMGDYLLGDVWPVPSGQEVRPGRLAQPFAPFWHGSMGVAWALFALAGLSREARFRRAALAMLDETLAAAPALPETDAPGVALGCLRLLPYLDDTTDTARRTQLCDRLDATLQATLTHGFGQNHALGHGDLGCLDLLLLASAALNKAPWHQRCAERAALMAANLQHYGWVTAVPLGVESPGLLAGLAGIGHGLLRLADPQWTPSILALELPRR